MKRTIYTLSTQIKNHIHVKDLDGRWRLEQTNPVARNIVTHAVNYQEVFDKAIKSWAGELEPESIRQHLTMLVGSRRCFRLFANGETWVDFGES